MLNLESSNQDCGAALKIDPSNYKAYIIICENLVYIGRKDKEPSH
jgi:outer membrane PBP1 activator LpoA protein